MVLICVRSGTDEASFKCVTEYFSDPGLRAERRVAFDKNEDRFDENAASTLRDIALPADAGVPRQGLTGPETLLTNLLPISTVGNHIWSASTDCVDREQVNARYAEADQAANAELPRAKATIHPPGREALFAARPEHLRARSHLRRRNRDSARRPGLGGRRRRGAPPSLCRPPSPHSASAAEIENQLAARRRCSTSRPARSLRM